MKRITARERAALVKIVQNICSLIAEIGVAIKTEAKPETRSYTEALIDGIDEMAGEQE